MPEKTYYKAKIIATEEGLQVYTQKWISLHETPCFHYCVTDFELRILRCQRHEEGILKAAKRRKLLKRIHKENSRFAFDTPAQAISHLRYLKRKQVGHMNREIEFLKCFLNTEDLEPHSDYYLVPGSRDLVHEYLAFD